MTARALRELERVEWRVLGALRAVDAATGTPIAHALRVDAPGATFTRNRSGLYVLRRWRPLAAHESEFLAPPATPAPGSLALNMIISDPTGTYLPVAASLRLPRVNDPAGETSPESLFRPHDVALHRSAAAPVGENWAVLRASVTATGSGDALGGALLRVVSNGSVLARGLTDWRGEALVAVVGVPVTTFSEAPDAVVVTEINVTVQAAFDPARGTRTPAADVRAGRPPAQVPVVDPLALDASFDALPRTQTALAIAARRRQSVALSISLP
jgi:hypothetical protein